MCMYMLPLLPTVLTVVTDGCWLGTQVLDVLARDTHYKYLVVMLVSSGTGFVIANWVGWQYYRNS